MSQTQPTIQTPPPLPLPSSGPGGQEPLPEDLARRHHAEVDADGTEDEGCDEGNPVRTYLIFMVFFTILWAVGGFGHFWPVYPALGWGLGLVLSGAVQLPWERRRG